MDDPFKWTTYISLLSLICALAIPSNVPAEDALSEENQKAFNQALANFNKEFSEIVKRLPPSAKVVVPSFETKLIISNPNPNLTEERILENASQWRDEIQNALFKSSVKVVDRDVLRHQEQEMVLTQTGIVDPQTSIKVGKSLGASHVVIGKLVWSSNPTSLVQTFTAKFIEPESMLLFGVATFNLSTPIIQSSQKIPPPPLNVCNLTGQWNSTYGPMALMQNGMQITGNYTFNILSGSLQGSVQGGLVEWYWQQSDGDRGWGQWTIMAGCRDLVGRWGRMRADLATGQPVRQIAGEWNASR